MAVILGLDPATHSVGFALLQDGKLLDHGAWQLGGNVPLYSRLKKLWECLETLPTVDLVAVELPYINPRFRLDTGIKLSIAVGVVYGWAILHGLQVVAIYPSMAKKAATGNGRASKEQVQEAIKARFNLLTIKEDAADAVACALAGQNSLSLQNDKGVQ